MIYYFKQSFTPFLSSVTAGLILTSAAALADKVSQPPVEELTVFGRAEQQLGVATSSSEGSVGGADLLVRPMLKVAELLEAMPGMVAVQHSGSGKANQYFLRGFNLDHGTDYTLAVDGAVWNLRSHGHGQGYLDVNGLIAESVARIDYRKGPYFPAFGDFSLAGSSSIATIDRLDRGFISLEGGEYGWGRIASGNTFELGDGELTLIAESKQYDGPWEQEEDLSHQAVWGKYLLPTSFGSATFSLSGYQAEWQPTEQIPERAIGTTVCEDEYCALDDSAKGETSRWIANSQLKGTNWSAGASLQYYDWSMLSNPTYDFQINQFDERWLLAAYASRLLLDTQTFQLKTGIDLRYDDITEVGLDQYEDGRFVAGLSDNEIEESSAGIYIDAQWSVTEQLRLSSGLRGDYYTFDVSASSTGAFAGDDGDEQLSPSLGAAYLLTDSLELYANWGKGFHSNDARGVVNSDDPVPGLSEGEGYELGARAAVGDLRMTATYWWLDQDSELIFVGDSNSVEPKGGSQREGYELTVFWQPLDGVGIDASYANSRARYNDTSEGAYVENAIEETAQLGISVSQGQWEVSARVRYLGAYALTADNQHRSDPLTTVNVRSAFHWHNVTIYGEVINLLDNDDKDISYYYPAYIEGLDAPGLSADDIDCDSVDCNMSRATEPRTVRAGIRYNF